MITGCHLIDRSLIASFSGEAMLKKFGMIFALAFAGLVFGAPPISEGDNSRWSLSVRDDRLETAKEDLRVGWNS